MYEKFYGFHTKPFHIVPNPDFLFLTQKHRNALTYLEYGLTERVGFILLSGEIGIGKTTLIRHLLNQIEHEIDVAVIFNTNVTADELLCLILQEFELTPEKGDKARNLDLLYQFLIEKYSKGRKVLLIIDEAQNLADEVLEEVRMLSNLHSDDQMLLQVMLVGQPELNYRLRKPNLAQLAQRIVVNYHLFELNKAETEQYIRHRLEKAGGRPDLFSPEAMEVIYRASAGIPRTINILCDTALVYGFADELPTIDVPIIEQVLRDRGGMGQHIDAASVFSSRLAESGSGCDREILHRLQALADQVQRLQKQMEWQFEEIQQRGEAFKDEIVQKMQSYIIKERQQCGRISGDYAAAKLKYHELLRARAEGKEGKEG